MTIEERNRPIEKYIPIVERIVGTIMRGGQPPYIEADDLRQEGYLALLGCVGDTVSGCSLEGRIARRVLDAILFFICEENKHWENRTDWESLFNADGEPKL